MKNAEELKQLVKEESKEHPKLGKKQIRQIAIDHLKMHKYGDHPAMQEVISQIEGDESDGEENAEEAFPGRDATKNKFNAMSKMKADIEAEKAGASD